ncbi:MAG: AraC family transcriptional regulator, partial [Firmicutes bacterium]|nr:AraC family transcriptional regulator [Bacillota bacterium]
MVDTYGDPLKAKPPILSVGFVLLPEFTLSTFSTFADVLRLAADSIDHSRQRLCHWTILGPDLAPIKSSCGARIIPDKVFNDPAQYDYLVVCGGLLKGHDAIPAEVFGYLSQAEQAGAHLIGLCTGSFVLAAMGMLQHHTACIHWV